MLTLKKIKIYSFLSRPQLGLRLHAGFVEGRVFPSSDRLELNEDDNDHFMDEEEEKLADAVLALELRRATEELEKELLRRSLNIYI